MAENEREDNGVEAEHPETAEIPTPVTDVMSESLEEADPAVCEALDDEAAQIACLEEQLAELEQKAAEYLNGWQRAQANFENFRKRTEAERVNLRKAANAALLARLLPILDDFSRAFHAIPEALAEDSWIEGVRLIERKVNAILESEDVQAIALEPGDPFDPTYHQAVLHQETEGFDDGQIVAEIERGYVLGDRILRPSMVVVAKSPPSPPAAPAEEDIVEAEGVVVEASPDDDPDAAPDDSV